MFREVLMAVQVERIKKGQRIYEPLAPALHLMGTNQDGREAVGTLAGQGGSRGKQRRLR